MKKTIIISILLCALASTLLLAQPLPAKAVVCSSHTSKQCISNILYWYNSCGALESLAQNCNNTNQICQSGQCVNKPITQTSPTPNNPSPTIVGNSPKPTPTQNQSSGEDLSLAMFAIDQTSAPVWAKTINVKNNDNLQFLIMVKNNSKNPIADASVQIDFTSVIAYTGNLKINGADINQNPLSGINLPTIDPKTSIIISFTGAAKSDTNQSGLQIVTSISDSKIIYDSDFVTFNIVTANQTPQISTSPVATKTPASSQVKQNPILDNLKKNWYLWIAALIVLVAVFIIIFRKLSSNI
jgi:hypothetical protein